MIMRTKASEIQSYIEDTSNIDGRATVLYIPDSAEEFSSLFSQLSSDQVPITLSAGGTGTTGGRVPLDGVVVSIERLNKILKIDPADKTIYLQAGVPLAQAEQELNSFGLSLRAQPTEPLALTGGVVSTCASGPKSFKYSSIRDYVRYLKVILSDGFILEINRGEIFAQKRKFTFEFNGRKFLFKLPSYKMPSVKHSAGYYIKDDMDLIDLFIGQEGTLGCIVEIGLDVQDMPLDFYDCIAFFPSDKDALAFVNELKKLKESGDMYPCSVEFFDGNSLDFLREDYPAIPECDCAVYFEHSIDFPEEAEKLLDYYVSLIEKHNSSLGATWFADNPRNRQRMRDFRHKLPQRINEYLRNNGTRKMATDIAVSDEAFPKMYSFYKSVAEKSGMHFVNFGHIGQNHLHFNFLPKNKEESFRMKGCILEIIEKAVSLGGTVSAEHGIGKIKKPYLKILFGTKHLKEMANLKKVFDPACILNLDNMFDKELLD